MDCEIYQRGRLVPALSSSADLTSLERDTPDPKLGPERTGAAPKLKPDPERTGGAPKLKPDPEVSGGAPKLKPVAGASKGNRGLVGFSLPSTIPGVGMDVIAPLVQHLHALICQFNPSKQIDSIGLFLNEIDS